MSQFSKWIESIEASLQRLKESSVYRHLRNVDSDNGREISIDGKAYLNFSSNNYLGLAQHSAIKQAAIDASTLYGTGSGASQLISGHGTLVQELENLVAAWKGQESALIFSTGYQANLGLLSSVGDEESCFILDRLVHASIIDGVKLSRAKFLVYAHNDMQSLESCLLKARPYKKKYIVSESIFSMDGDKATLEEMVAMKNKHEAILILDEAHAIGLYGRCGSGLTEELNLQSEVEIHMGTFSKALGSFGGYIASKRFIIEYLINHARSFIFTTGLPPSVIASSIKAIEILNRDDFTMLKEKAWQNINHLKKAFPNFHGESAIFPFIVHSNDRAIALGKSLMAEGIFAPVIRFPTVKKGSERIRFSLSALHSEKDIEYLINVLSKHT